MNVTLFHGSLTSRNLGRRLPMRSSSHELLHWCARARLVFNHQRKQNYTAQALMCPSIEHVGSRPRIDDHLSFEGHPRVRKFNSSTCVSPLRYSNNESKDPAVFRAACLQSQMKNWQEQRRDKLTASTFGGAIGLWPRRRVALWLEKLGMKEPFSGNLATGWSNLQEAKALETYRRITQNTVTYPTFKVYNEGNELDDWIAASADGLVERDEYGIPCRGLLEIKCPYFHELHMNVARPWNRIPLYHIPQAQGLLEVMDRDWMDFYVWTPRGSNLFRVYRDREYWEVLKAALSDFWFDHVLPAKELCDKYNFNNPFRQLPPSLRPARRHPDCKYIICESRRIVDNSPLLVHEMGGVVLGIS